MTKYEFRMYKKQRSWRDTSKQSVYWSGKEPVHISLSHLLTCLLLVFHNIFCSYIYIYGSNFYQKMSMHRTQINFNFNILIWHMYDALILISYSFINEDLIFLVRSGVCLYFPFFSSYCSKLNTSSLDALAFCQTCLLSRLPEGH